MVGAVTGNAFGSAGRRAAGTPLKASTSTPGILIQVLNNPSGNITVPAGANSADMAGLGGGGSAPVSSGNFTQNGGGSALAVSTISVKAGDTLNCTTGAAGASNAAGGATVVTYNGVNVLYADPGKASSASIVNGQASASIGNVRTASGGVPNPAVDVNGVSVFNSSTIGRGAVSGSSSGPQGGALIVSFYAR